MDGLILAAGCGSRLGTTSPKCLVRLGGRELIKIQLDALRQVGVRHVTIVVGYHQEEIRAAVPGEATFVVNGRYAETNSLYSFSLARQVAEGNLIVMNSDVVFPVEVLRRVLDVAGNAFAFDSGSGEDAEHMKVRLRGGRLVSMSKDMPAAFAHGENVGLLHLTRATARATFDAADAIIALGRHQDWLARAVNAVAGGHPIAGVDIAGLPWVEIDYPQDLALARDRIWPAIESSDLFAERSRRVATWLSEPDTAVAG